MNQDNVVLCISSAYDQKFYMNQDFNGLPQTIKEELQIMCVLYTEEIGGELILEFEPDGSLIFRVKSDEGDLLYDEIGSVLKIKEFQEAKKELLEALELYYKVFFLKQNMTDIMEKE